jgi:MFS family permease
MHGRESESLDILSRATGAERAATAIEDVKAMLRAEAGEAQGTLRELFAPAMKLVLTIGVAVAILQQITGINAVFFYAPMIFEQSGVGTDASFMQAVLVGLVNLVFTVLAIMTIDKLGRRPLLLFGLTVIAACMFLLAYGFGSATYTLTPEALAALPATFDATALQPLLSQTFHSDVAFREALTGAIGSEAMTVHQATLVSGAISMNPTLILLAILGFVAGFAISLGPVMWVLFSELFPNRVRGIAISFVGLINSGVSFLVQLVFPWELETLGNSTTFLIYGSFAVIGLIIVWRLLPETKGKSLEQLEAQLVHKP